MVAKSLEKLLNPNDDGELGGLVRRARSRVELEQVLRKSISADDQDIVLAANIRDNGELVVLTSSSAWAAKLRFEADVLLQAARSTGANVTSCTVRVNRS